jgi:hypothetical protein
MIITKQGEKMKSNNKVFFRLFNSLKKIMPVFPLLMISLAFQLKAQQNWTIRSPLQPQNHLHDVVWTGTSFVTVGDSGSVYRSNDGVNWTQTSCGIDTAYLTTVVWTGNNLVVGGRYKQIFISDDGKKWNVHTIESAWIKRIIWSGAMLVAAGLDGIYTSADGKTWEKRYSKGCRDIVWNGSIFVAVSDVPRQPSIITSTDGATWVSRDSGNHVYSVAWANNRFIAIGDTGSFAQNTLIYSSTDGLGWKKDTIQQVISMPSKIITAFGKLVAVSPSDLCTSIDGLAWTKTPVNGTLYGLAVNDSKIISVGTYGTILESSDAASWQNLSAFQVDFVACASSESLFVTAGGNSIVTSSDGQQWAIVSRFNLPGFDISINDIAWFEELFLAVGSWVDSAGIQRQLTGTSKNGMQWTIQDTGLSGGTNAVAWNGSGWILAGDSGKIVLLNTDGTQMARLSGMHHSLMDIVTGNGLTVIVGDSGTVLTSSNDSVWVACDANTPCNLNSICYGNHQYVVAGDSGIILASTDGIKWTRLVTGIQKQLRGICYTNNIFVAVGVDGTIISSVDGKNWQKQSAPLHSDLAAIGYRNNRFITAGPGSTILSSELTLTPTHICLTSNKRTNCLNMLRVFTYNKPHISATSITYILPQESHVKLSIYNLSGRLIQTLENQIKKAGVYSVNLFHNYNNVKRVNTGCYCVKLVTEYGTATCRMLVQ